MLQVRPTLKVLRVLPRDSFADPTAYDQVEKLKGATREVASRVIQDLWLDNVQHPLLDDARSFFNRNALPQLHQTSTQEIDSPVYEVRSTGGAAWRGAVTVEGDTAWLVHAEKHDRFHSTAASYFRTADYGPSSLDKKIEQRELAARELHKNDVANLKSVLSCLKYSVETLGNPQSTTLEDDQGNRLEITVLVEAIPPPDSVSLLSTETSDVWFTLTLSGGDPRLRDSVLRNCLAYIQPNQNVWEQTYSGASGQDMTVLMLVPHLVMAQLFVSDDTAKASSPQKYERSFIRHHVASDLIAEAYVLGRPVQALCGSWFVPTRDGEDQTLALCTDCERIQPAAQRYIDKLRDKLEADSHN